MDAGHYEVTNAFSIDVEDYFHVEALASAIDRSQWDGLEYRAEANTHRVLEILAQEGVRATFFVLGWVAKRSPQLVRDIHRAGHEVACHGLTHRTVYSQTPEVFRAETSEAKQRLEDTTGVPVRGYRAATYSITRRSLWALDILEELGFGYDSSIFPIRHDLYGIPGSPRFAYRAALRGRDHCSDRAGVRQLQRLIAMTVALHSLQAEPELIHPHPSAPVNIGAKGRVGQRVGTQRHKGVELFRVEHH